MELLDMTFSTLNLWVILFAAYFVWCVRCIIKERLTQREIRESPARPAAARSSPPDIGAQPPHTPAGMAE
jgi:hypothetical protein